MRSPAEIVADIKQRQASRQAASALAISESAGPLGALGVATGSAKWKHRFAWRCENCRQGGIVEIAFPISIYDFDDYFWCEHRKEESRRACVCPGPVQIDLLPNIVHEPHGGTNTNKLSP